MKELLLSSMFAAVAMLSSAATASYNDGKLTLDFIGDWAVVDNGTGNISIVNGEGQQLATAIGTPDYDFTNTGDYQVLVYNMDGQLEAGEYTVKVADGAIIGHKTDPWSFDLASIGALELPVSVSAVEGGDNPDQPGEDPEQPANAVIVDFKVGSSLAAITNNMVVANITVDREYYDIYWTVTCATDPDFFFGGSNHEASKGAGTYTIIASTPSSQPVELNSGNTYTFTFQTCEFGWDGYKTVATFDVEGAGAAAEQFSDIVITDFSGTLGTYGYYFQNKYTFTFSAPVTNVKAFVPLGMDGLANFPVAAADNEGLKWTVDVSSMANEEGAFELHITAVDAATGLRLLGTYHLDNSFIYTISVSTSNPDDQSGNDPDLPSEEVEIATITINGVVYHLSEVNAIELDAYPEGALFTITLADEAIKKVSYEIIDHTTGEILKSIADLEKGENGEWTAVMPLTYQMVAGHEFYVHVIARDGMSSFTSQILYEYNFLVNGTNSNVATYSSVKVASITPSTDEIIRTETPVITIAFTEAIAEVSVTAILGQMDDMPLDASCITTTDQQTWQIAVPAGIITGGSLSLNIVAIDNEGHRVTDAENGVGLPEDCYLQYGWASTIGLPTPELTEGGQSVTCIEALHFTYDGIGLNQDMATATWQQITIARNGEVLPITLAEEMFAVSGDDSVGGTILTLTLPEALSQAGVYTIDVPAFAFILGHDQSNAYNGDCQFTVTIEETTGISAILMPQHIGAYSLDGSRVERLSAGSIYVIDGQKVIVK